MLGRLVDVVFPPRCAACDAVGPPWCVACLEQLVVLEPPGCRTCGRPLPLEVDRCAECPPGPASWWRSALLYEGPVRACLMRLKFGGVRSAADALAPPMAEALLRWGRAPSWGPADSPPVVTWVPLAARRRRSRGYDQAEVLARSAARRAGLPVARLLVRTRDTPPQARQDAAGRRHALDGAFRVAPSPRRRARGGGSDPWPPPRVVLVDDVLTTGATTAACARTLLAGGADEVGVLAAARSLRSGVPSRCRGAGGPLPAPDGPG